MGPAPAGTSCFTTVRLIIAAQLPFAIFVDGQYFLSRAHNILYRHFISDYVSSLVCVACRGTIHRGHYVSYSWPHFSANYLLDPITSLHGFQKLKGRGRVIHTPHILGAIGPQ